MSTTYDKKNAYQFAQEGGNILLFNIDKLEDDCPMLIIDETMADHLHESEVLFLPGTITIVNNKNNVSASYKMNQKVVNQYIAAQVSPPKYNNQKGGAETILLRELEEQSLMGNKWLIFYRSIHGRHPEILTKVKVPKNVKKLDHFFRYTYRNLVEQYDIMMNLMPEVQDIQQWVAKQGKKMDIEEKRELWKKMESYQTYIAIYNPMTNQVETLTYGFPEVIMLELGFDMGQLGKLKELILDECQFLKQTN
jgi:hypothetical protein